MDSERDTNSNSGSQNPFSILGLKKGASFEDIQHARDSRLNEIGDDVLAKAKIEAAYDSLLMDSLKSRQLGNASNEALIASNKEKNNKDTGFGIGNSLLTRLQKINPTEKNAGGQDPNNKFNLPIGQNLLIRISAGFLALILILVSPEESIQIILSLSTIGLFISQISSGRKPLQSIFWCLTLLSVGLIIGGLFFNGKAITPDQVHTFSGDNLEAIPAIILLWLGSLLLA